MKTIPTDNSVSDFLLSVEHVERRQDCQTVMAIMKEITGQEPVMWGSSIIGYGQYHDVYASGREGDWFLTGLSPRKQSLTLYIMSGFSNQQENLARLGRFKTGKGCLYIRKLEDINLDILRQLIEESVVHLQQKYPG